eukprot:Protomagalhaensia_sp_Gyna_25__4949@NODE_535_length_3184_cov_84_221622_g419_i0_p5_GENE_NODE_535_length_3184_cov_84_221622_g419_i0NODE_535_length_3184_cov_84_221622_g419_i0_p5_ORF_typecomplete_len106_score14_59DUF3488/PF11992_8/0_037DUF4536/PF15055_6/1_3e03DUF4536/PF15055_6/0_95_NODE_535_length_3184_cov_84_221622_g419_i011441461
MSAISDDVSLAQLDQTHRLAYYKKYFSLNETLAQDLNLLHPERWDTIEPRIQISVDALLGLGALPVFDFKIPFIVLGTAILGAGIWWLWQRRRPFKGRGRGKVTW